MSYVFVHNLHDRLGEPQYVEEQGFDRDSDKPASGGLYAVGKWEGSQTATGRGHLSLMGSDGHSSTDASARGNPDNAKGKVEDWSVGFAMPGSSTLAVDRLAMESMGELVPGVGLEPTRLAAGDFESPASTCFTTRAGYLATGENACRTAMNRGLCRKSPSRTTRGGFGVSVRAGRWWRGCGRRSRVACGRSSG